MTVTSDKIQELKLKEKEILGMGGEKALEKRRDLQENLENKYSVIISLSFGQCFIFSTRRK